MSIIISSNKCNNGVLCLHRFEAINMTLSGLCGDVYAQLELQDGYIGVGETNVAKLSIRGWK